MNAEERAYIDYLISVAAACGDAYNYDVEGYCDGDYYYGEVKACSNNKQVTGDLYDQNSDSFQFSGEWVSKGQFEGTVEPFGASCELEVD